MRIWPILLALVSCQAKAIGAHAPIEVRVAHRLAREDTRGLAHDALARIVNRAADAFEDRGRPELAEQLRSDWTRHYAAVTLGALGDVGDHPPLSEWLDTWYEIMADTFGLPFMETSHLRDLWVLNFTLPVVTAPEQTAPWCQDQLKRHPEDTCQREYRRHFAGTKYGGIDPYANPDLHHGFAGVVTYWLVWGACEAATSGAGQVIICSPAGTVAEDSMELLLAGQISDGIWARHN